MMRICLLLLLLYASPLWAQERILSYDSQVQVNADGSLDVTEHIRVRAEGKSIRRGIYRDFPIRYRDRHGRRVVVGFEMIDVQRDGRPEPWFTETVGNGIRINTGNDDFLPVPGEFTFTLRYRTTRQLGFFDGHDELYWNAIGTGWIFAIERGSVEVGLPEPVPMGQLAAEGYTGAQGTQGRDYLASIPAPGIARWELTRPLAPHEGFTIVLSFPKGVVAAPSRAQSLWWLLRDNLALLVALLGLAWLLAYCVRTWHRIGRDPAPGTIIVRYEPPADFSPGCLRQMLRRAYDTRCFSADVLSLAVGGELTIKRDKRLLKDDWTLERGAGHAGFVVPPAQKPLLAGLFAGGRRSLELEKGNAASIQQAMQAHAKTLKQRLEPDYLKRNGSSVLKAFLILLVSVVAALLLSAANMTTGLMLAAVFVVVGLMLATWIAFIFLVQAPTPKGRALLDEIEGLKRYLTVAERQDLARLPGPQAEEPLLDAERFEFLLPYAVALEVEEAWTKKFTLAAGAAAAAAATASIAWYRGSDIGSIGNFSQAIGSSLSSQIASSSTPPGSSSGSGGGGSSGGGGGGGGGGGR